ncbi:hypothetical protein [Streptomyces sp. SBT349]|nr:hypothetical protein [Streptomyces sp. SBT349]
MDTAVLAYVPPEAQGGETPGWVGPAVVGVVVLLLVMIYLRSRRSGSDD